MSLYFSGYESIFKKLNKGFVMAGNSTRHTVLTLTNGETLKLTKQQMLFARNFVLTGDAIESRRIAGYAKTEKYEQQESYKLLQVEKTQQAIKHYRAEAEKKIDISEERILAEMAAMAFGNVAKLFNESGEFKDIQDMDAFTQRSIKAIKIRHNQAGEQITEIDQHPKLAALKLISEIKGMTNRDDDKSNRPVNVNVNINGKQVDVDEN